MNYEAIIFDLDGTAIPNDISGLPSPAVVSAIRAAEAHGILTAATGRPARIAKNILDVLQLKHPCVVSAGTQIIDAQSRDVLWEVSLELSDIKKVLTVCEPYDYEILVREQSVSEGAAARDCDIREAVNVIYIMGVSHADASELMALLQPIVGITASPVLAWWHDGVDIHITHREATKEHALQELFRRLEIDPAKTIGVGDGDNDIHLFKSVGYKVAMGNATDKLKLLADRVIGDVEDDGLAHFISEMFIQKDTS